MFKRADSIDGKKEYFKALLTKTLQELSTGAEKKRGMVTYFRDYAGDFADNASIETDSVLTFRIREREGRFAERIEKALKKLEDGTFGICEECGSKISEKRLMVRPIAALCLSCKKKEEASEKIMQL